MKTPLRFYRKTDEGQSTESQKRKPSSVTFGDTFPQGKVFVVRTITVCVKQ
ncbi:MAG: hypothetical protein IKV66_01930 [Clostridia bacterium]|nr:hypothetical protein [Clostridia bacterium]